MSLEFKKIEVNSIQEMLPVLRDAPQYDVRQRISGELCLERLL